MVLAIPLMLGRRYLWWLAPDWLSHHSAIVWQGHVQYLETSRNEQPLFTATLGGIQKLLRSRVVVVVSVVFMLLSSTINTAMSGLIVTYSKLSMFSMSDATTGYFWDARFQASSNEKRRLDKNNQMVFYKWPTYSRLAPNSVSRNDAYG